MHLLLVGFTRYASYKNPFMWDLCTELSCHMLSKEDRAFSWYICMRASYVLFMFKTLYSMCFPSRISLMFTVISHTDHIVESLSQNTTSLVSIAFVCIWSPFDKAGTFTERRGSWIWRQICTSNMSFLDLYWNQGVSCGLFFFLVTFWLSTLRGQLVLLSLNAHTIQELKPAGRKQRKYNILSMFRKKRRYDTIRYNNLTFFWDYTWSVL